jgi:hypothetical protein
MIVKSMLALVPLVLATAANGQIGAPAPKPALGSPQLVVAAPAAPSAHPGAIVVPKHTLVRLMVLNEVNTHDSRIGDRFVLRVDENVSVGDATIIPVGARAWGEVTAIKQNGALGKSGRLGARLLYVEAGNFHVPVTGEEETKGNAGGDRVAMAVVGFGPFGLLARGTQGKLKAGAIFNGYLDGDLLFDPATKTLLAPEGPAQ